MLKQTFANHLQWCLNERNGVLNHQRLDCLLNRLFRHRLNQTSKLRVTGLCEDSPRKGPVTRKMFPFDDVIMSCLGLYEKYWYQQSNVVVMKTVSGYFHNIGEGKLWQGQNRNFYYSGSYNHRFMIFCLKIWIFKISPWTSHKDHWLLVHKSKQCPWSRYKAVISILCSIYP